MAERDRRLASQVTAAASRRAATMMPLARARTPEAADGPLLAAAAMVAGVAIVARLHNAFTYPAMYDWDASGHAVNVVDLLEGHLPNPRSWCGSHPPLYYALSAGLSVLLPASVPVHVTMRLLSIGAWIVTVGLVWRSVRRLVGPVDAAAVAAVLLGMPGLTIASCMTTNDALCALFVTATVVRLLEAPPGRVPLAADAAATGALAGLAALTKATGMAAVGMAAAFYVWRARLDVRRGLRALVVLVTIAGAIAGPFYLWLFVSLSGSPYAIVATRAGSREKELIATVVHAIAGQTTSFSSLPALAHAALWGDPTAVLVPRRVSTELPGRLVSAGGLIVTAVAAAGILRLVIRRVRMPTAAVALVFGVAYAAALVPHVVDRPYIVLTKTNYILPEALPIGIVLAVGLGWVSGRLGTAMRLAVLAVALGGVRLTVYGWWDAVPRASGPVEAPPAASPPARAVDRYFAYRARDPVRAVRLLAPQVQLDHELRLVRILDLPPLGPEPGLTPESARSLELARARVAWLELYNLVRWIQPIAGALHVKVVDVVGPDDRTEVRAEVVSTGAPPPAGGEVGLWPFPGFEQDFTLARRADGWRITGISQRDVVDDNAVQAFVAYPTLTAFQHLKALGWRPPWEKAIASVAPAAP